MGIVLGSTSLLEAQPFDIYYSSIVGYSDLLVPKQSLNTCQTCCMYKKIVLSITLAFGDMCVFVEG